LAIHGESLKKIDEISKVTIATDVVAADA